LTKTVTYRPVNLATVAADLKSSLSLAFYQSAEDAVLKVFGVE
jgi:predicted ATP-dependent Lon-type protease